MYHVLIETSWNVKTAADLMADDWKLVLIETSWNVKKKMFSQIGISTYVLIETSWNVKEVQLILIMCYSGINRNIVECKG